jgi:hypothetical protein
MRKLKKVAFGYYFNWGSAPNPEVFVNKTQIFDAPLPKMTKAVLTALCLVTVIGASACTVLKMIYKFWLQSIFGLVFLGNDEISSSKFEYNNNLLGGAL